MLIFASTEKKILTWEKKRNLDNLIDSLSSPNWSIKRMAFEAILRLKESKLNDDIFEKYSLGLLRIEDYFSYLDSLDKVDKEAIITKNIDKLKENIDSLFFTHSIDFIRHSKYLSRLGINTTSTDILELMEMYWENIMSNTERYQRTKANIQNIVNHLKATSWKPNNDRYSLIYYALTYNKEKLLPIGDDAAEYIYYINHTGGLVITDGEYIDYLEQAGKEVAIKFSLMELTSETIWTESFIQILDKHKWKPDSDDLSQENLDIIITYYGEKNMWNKIKKLGPAVIPYFKNLMRELNKYEAPSSFDKKKVAQLLVDFNEVGTARCNGCNRLVPSECSSPGYCPFCQAYWATTRNLYV